MSYISMPAPSKALGLLTLGSTLEMQQLPQSLQKLEPYPAEDFLCIFKEQFAGARVEPRGCEPKASNCL